MSELVSFHLFLKYTILIIEMKHICLSSLQLNTKYISRYQKDTTVASSIILSIRINAAVHRTGILLCFQFLKSAQQRRSTATEATEILLLGKYYYLLSKYFNQLSV